MSRKVKGEIRHIYKKQTRLNRTYRHTLVKTPFHLAKITKIVRVFMIKSQKY